jgi:hypothetical protein
MVDPAFECVHRKRLPGRALTIRERTLDPEHLDVATSLENRAVCLRAMDRHREADPLEARAMAIRAKSAATDS